MELLKVKLCSQLLLYLLLAPLLPKSTRLEENFASSNPRNFKIVQ